MKFGLKMLLGMSFGALLLGACAAPMPVAPAEGGTPAAAEESSEPVVLTVARNADANVWDPKFTNDNNSLWAQIQIYATLLQNSPDGTEILPWLAETYESNADATEFTFKLHDDALFCDGTPITAEDVKFSFDRAMEEDSAVSWQYPSGAVVEVIDPLNLKITLSKSNVPFPSYLTLWGTNIVSKAYAEEVGNEVMAEKPLGSGPMCLESWEKGQRMVFTPNPGYWGDDGPYVDQIDLVVVTDDNARVLQIQSGEADIITDVPYNQTESLKGSEGVEVFVDTLYGNAAIPLNQVTVPEFADQNVRLAMAYAVNRQAIVDAVLFGNGKPAMSPFSGAGVLYWTDEFGIEYDIDKAKEYMAASSAPDGFATELIIQSGDSLAGQTAVILKDQLAQIGIELTITPVDPDTWWELWSGKNFEMIYKLATNDIIDPAENLPFDFWPAADGGTDGAFTGYYNEEIVALSKEAEAELDPAKRAELYSELQRIAMEESPFLWLFHPSNRWATRDNVDGFSIFPTGMYRLWQVSLTE